MDCLSLSDADGRIISPKQRRRQGAYLGWESWKTASQTLFCRSTMHCLLNTSQLETQMA